MTRLCRPITLLLPFFAASVLPGCAMVGTGNYNYNNTFGTEVPYQPNPDGPAAMYGSNTVIPNLHLAYASSSSFGVFGPGVALFNGHLLEVFSKDGDLSPTVTPNSQSGFFMRPTSTYSGSRNEVITGSGGNDELIAWGTWAFFDGSLGYSLRFTEVTRGNFVEGILDYVVGQLTPAASLPQVGLARYRPISQTDDSGLSVLWGSSTVKVGLDLLLDRFSYSNSERLRTTGGLDNPSNSEISVHAGTATFGGNGVPYGPCPQGSTCQGRVEGFFAGPNAERAGLSYQTTQDGIFSFGGAVAFAFSDFIVPPGPPAPPPGPITLLEQTNPNAFAMTFAASNVFGPVTAGPPATATQAADGQLTAFNFASSPGNTVNVGRGTTQSPAAETGSDSLITWGRWTNGTTTGSAPGFGALTLGPNQGFHYVVGAATPPANMPPANPGPSGMATFTLMGATKPTFGDGALAPGTFTGSMAVLWGGAAATKVGVDFTVTMPGDATYRMVSNGGVASPGTSLISTSGGSSFTGPAPVTVTGTGRACPLPCSANVGGFFAGPNAERAGVAYTIGLVPATTIQGAAAFTR